MAETCSPSQHWRQQGNSVYVTAKDGLSPVIRRERLRNASNCYYKAYNLSQNEDDQVSAAKNLAMVSWKMARVEEATMDRFSTLLYFYKEAFKYFSYALNHGKDVKPQDWLDNLLASARTCWEEFLSGKVEEQGMDNRIHVFHEIVEQIQIDGIKAECYYHTANCHFHAGISAIQSGDYKRGLCEMKDCYTPLNEAKSCAGDSVVVEGKCRVLEEDVLMHLFMAESMQARDIGDQLYQKVTLDEEGLNMDMVWEIIDWYKQSVLRTREVTEVELEAVALSRLGRVYDKVLKLKYKAKECLMRAVQLAHSMHPRTFNNEDWFKETTATLQKYQDEAVHQEEEKWNKEREELKKGLEKQLKDLEREDGKGDLDFVRYVYRAFPPKNPTHKLEGIPKKKSAFVAHDVIKKTLQKAIVHYHPDHVDTEKHGKVWKVLAEEITKLLTRKYERMK